MCSKSGTLVKILTNNDSVDKMTILKEFVPLMEQILFSIKESVLR